MGRLKALPSRLAPPPERLKRQTDAQGHDPDARIRAWYGSRRWKALRWDTLVRDQFTCQCGCKHIETDTSELVADHKTPHGGDEALFWDPNNLWTLRANPCHNREKQREEVALRHGRGA